MPIVIFQNNREATLTFVVEPAGEKREIPQLALIGVRYSLAEGAEDRCHSIVSEQEIEFWCNADNYEVDVVNPSAYDKLSWDICVSGGWCGGIVDGKPTTVDDLLPKSGIVTAEDFAKLTVRADGWPTPKPVPDKHLRWLEAKFIEHFGMPSVDVAMLRPNLTRPFESDAFR